MKNLYLFDIFNKNDVNFNQIFKNYLEHYNNTLNDLKYFVEKEKELFHHGIDEIMNEINDFSKKINNTLNLDSYLIYVKELE